MPREEIKVGIQDGKVTGFFWHFVFFTMVVGLVPFIWANYVWTRVGDFEMTGRLLQRWNLTQSELAILDATIHWLQNRKQLHSDQQPNFQRIEEQLEKKMTQLNQMQEHVESQMSTIEDFYSRVSATAEGLVSAPEDFAVALKSLKTSVEEDVEKKLSDAVRRVGELELELELVETKWREAELWMGQVGSLIGAIDPEAVVAKAKVEISQAADQALTWLIQKVENDQTQNTWIAFIRHPIQWIFSYIASLF